MKKLKKKETRAVRRIEEILGSFADDGQSRILRRLTGSNASVYFAAPVSGNIMEIIHLVMKESVRERNEDKRYWLSKIRMYNKISQALSSYLRDLYDALTDDDDDD